MRGAAFKPLLSLAAAAMLAQSGVPEWGEHLLSCGFTNALRTIESVATVKSASAQSGAIEAAPRCVEKLAG